MHFITNTVHCILCKKYSALCKQYNALFRKYSALCKQYSALSHKYSALLLFTVLLSQKPFNTTCLGSNSCSSIFMLSYLFHRRSSLLREALFNKGWLISSPIVARTEICFVFDGKCDRRLILSWTKVQHRTNCCCITVVIKSTAGAEVDDTPL